MSEKRKRAYERGHRAEWWAAAALLLKGFRIVARRFKTPVGEIDLIMRRGQLVVFVEVKARHDDRTALDAISRSSQQRIENAAQWWLSQQADAAQLSWRFDVVAIVPRRWPRHFENVW
ncbi:MAG: YraN family protein [Ahrensia sp.]|nr:YraN family protein [Ahrensia sp.]